MIAPFIRSIDGQIDWDATSKRDVDNAVRTSKMFDSLLDEVFGKKKPRCEAYHCKETDVRKVMWDGEEEGWLCDDHYWKFSQ